MQWLIDIAIEAMEQYLIDNPRYVDRGDPAAFDFVFGDFIKDGTWHELDLSAIIPTDAQCVHANFFFAGDTTGRSISFQTAGNVNGHNIQDCHQHVASFPTAYGVLVHPSSDRKIEYLAEVSGWFQMFFVVRGWWL